MFVVCTPIYKSVNKLKETSVNQFYISHWKSHSLVLDDSVFSSQLICSLKSVIKE